MHGMVRRHAVPVYPNFAGIQSKLHLHEGDLADEGSLRNVVFDVRPEHVYNLGSQSHVGTSFAQPAYTHNVTGEGPVRLMRVLKEIAPRVRLYQASSSEMFGNAFATHGLDVLDEGSPMEAASPYALAKLHAHRAARWYREQGLFVSCGILFNHESERRGVNFVTRKVTLGLARMSLGLQDKLVLGNVTAYRDWGYAPEFCEAMIAMLRAEKPDDFVVATGEAHSVAQWVEAAWKAAGFSGKAADDTRVQVSSEELRPTDVQFLRGDAKKAWDVLKWQPKTTFSRGPGGSLVEVMMRNDLALARTEAEGGRP